MADTQDDTTHSLPTDLRQWSDSELRKHHLPPVSAVETVLDRPWSRVWRLSTPEQTLYCKAVASYMRPEVALTGELNRSHPDLVAHIVAAESSRGWMLLADAGPMMRQAFAEKPFPEPWFRILADYARLQIDWMEHSIPLRSLGLPDRSMPKLADLVAPLLDEAVDTPVTDESDRFSPKHRERLEAILSDWASYTDSLYPSELSDTLNHGDLHDGNIAWHEDEARILDWGDASVSHPFMSMRTVLIALNKQFGDVYPFIQAYLAPWKAQLPDVDIDALFKRSRNAWPLVSALSWHHALQDTEDARRESYRHAIPSLLRECVDDWRD